MAGRMMEKLMEGGNDEGVASAWKTRARISQPGGTHHMDARMRVARCGRRCGPTLHAGHGHLQLKVKAWCTCGLVYVRIYDCIRGS